MRAFLRHDLPASIVVFLIAIPLSLGIAAASGAPLLAGLVAAVVGGIVAGALGGAPLQVSGPAAGLTVIVAGTVAEFGLAGTAAIVAHRRPGADRARRLPPRPRRPRPLPGRRARHARRHRPGHRAQPGARAARRRRRRAPPGDNLRELPGQIAGHHGAAVLARRAHHRDPAALAPPGEDLAAARRAGRGHRGHDVAAPSAAPTWPGSTCPPNPLGELIRPALAGRRLLGEIAVAVADHRAGRQRRVAALRGRRGQDCTTARAPTSTGNCSPRAPPTPCPARSAACRSPG